LKAKEDEARNLATGGAIEDPLPTDEQNPTAGDANHEDLILWLARKEARQSIECDASTPPRNRLR
jgi:hypothetical protein